MVAGHKNINVFMACHCLFYDKKKASFQLIKIVKSYNQPFI